MNTKGGKKLLVLDRVATNVEILFQKKFDLTKLLLLLE